MSSHLNPFAEARRQRKYELIVYIANPNLIVQKDSMIEARRLVGSFSIQWGISERVIYQYLNELQDAGLIQYNGVRVKIAVTPETLDEMFGSREAWQTQRAKKEK